MKIINKKVEHKNYGAGTICAMNGGSVCVEFGKLFGMKRFPYPQKLWDEALQEELMEDLLT